MNFRIWTFNLTERGEASMPFFEYRARDKKNRITTGVVEAPSISAADKILAGQGWLVLSVKKRKKTAHLEDYLKFLNRVSTRDLVAFSRQFAVMIAANLPVVQALRVLVKQTTNTYFETIISEMANEVEGGAKLSAALSHYPNIFSDFYVNIVGSGETIGKLDKVLHYLADQQEKDYDLMSKIKGAMIYPIFVLMAMAGIGVVMMIFVIPKLTDVLKETGGDLPMATKILMGASDFMIHYWWLLLGGVIVLAVTVRVFLKTPAGKKFFDYFLLKLPIFGKLFQRIYLIRFTRSLATLVVGGVALTKGLKITAGIVGNTVYRDLITRTIKEVEEGNSISTVFMESKEMPQMVSQMLIVGEKTGRIDKVLERLTDFYTMEMDNLITNLTSLMEPLIMVILGVGVGIMVAAIIMPMYNMAGSF